MKITIPHTKQIGESGEVTRATLNDLMRATIDASTAKPCVLEIYDSLSQRFLFVRERQIYAAAELNGGAFAATSIRDFLLGATNMSFPRATWYELNTKIIHSVLVVAQKKPALRVMTSLVDLDELLDRIEKEGKSCIVAATREDFLAMLRYEKGKTAAFCWEQSITAPREASFREDFLIKVYSNAAERPMNVSLYEDFLVSYAPDAKNLPESFNGRFADVFLSKPPVVILRFKDREIGRWEMDRPRLRIGRTPDNDIVIDNLGVSRLHAVIEEEKGAYSVRDCDSLNGTVVNGERTPHQTLQDGDEISIGKHTIVFRVPSGHAIPEPETIAGFDQTMIISRSSVSHTNKTQEAPAMQARASAPTRERTPRLVIHTDYGDRVVEIADEAVTIGRDEDADVRVNGMFVASRHAEITRENGRVVLRRVGGMRAVKVRGRSVKEVELKDNDEIQIASELFVFHE
ncbi:MAG TPA: FHA domain-containing protein [Candidatus Krumholzibacteria bacterium]|nr:FHA domain-containing protein [Candidatus Krumholzibacteria bacterium]